MSIFDKIYTKAQANPARMAFPEAENEKMLLAAKESAEKGYIKPVLVGNKTAITEACGKYNIDTSLFKIVDIADEALQEDLVERYTATPGRIYGKKALMRRMGDPLLFSFVMQAVDEVDCTFAGIENTTGNVILVGQTILGLAPGVTTVSSCGIFEVPGYQGTEGELMAFGDSAVCQNPNAEELASIAISACDTLHSLLDWEPRCALLSFSTKGSGEGPMVDKVREAVAIANEKRPELLIEGEFQLDSAINPDVAAKKVGEGSKVAGKANIIIWPDLNAGNIGVKLVQGFANANAYGPLLQGFNKVVADCSRSAPVSELVGNIAITAVRAMNTK